MAEVPNSDEILTDLLELEYRQQQLLEFTQRVIGKAIAAGWKLQDTVEEEPFAPVGPHLRLVPPIPDRLPPDISA